MNEFSYLAERYREYLETSDLMAHSMRLADMPCRPSEYNSAARQINGFSLLHDVDHRRRVCIAA